MPPALDLGVAGAVRPWPRSIPQSFSLWFPRWCLRLRVGLSPPFRPTAAFTRRALESLFWGGARPPRKASLFGLAPASTGVYYEGPWVGVCAVCCRVRAVEGSPPSFPVFFPRWGKKSPGPAAGGCGPRCCAAPPEKLRTGWPCVFSLCGYAGRSAQAAAKGLRSAPPSQPAAKKFLFPLTLSNICATIKVRGLSRCFGIRP